MFKLTGEDAISAIRKSNGDICISASRDGITTYLDIDKKKFLSRLKHSNFIEIEIDYESLDDTIWLRKLSTQYKP